MRNWTIAARVRKKKKKCGQKKVAVIYNHPVGIWKTPELASARFPDLESTWKMPAAAQKLKIQQLPNLIF